MDTIYTIEEVEFKVGKEVYAKTANELFAVQAFNAI